MLVVRYEDRFPVPYLGDTNVSNVEFKSQAEREQFLFSAVGDGDLPWIREMVERQGVDLRTPEHRPGQLPVFAVMRLGGRETLKHAEALVWLHDRGLFDQNYKLKDGRGLQSSVNKARAVVEAHRKSTDVHGFIGVQARIATTVA